MYTLRINKYNNIDYMDEKQCTPAEKSAYMKEEFKPGSDAALARGKKIAAARAIKPDA